MVACGGKAEREPQFAPLGCHGGDSFALTAGPHPVAHHVMAAREPLIFPVFQRVPAQHRDLSTVRQSSASYLGVCSSGLG